MEDNHLSSFSIQGFKKFDDLLVEDLGQFNLIVGDNNVGKTTLLEALLINTNVDTLNDSLANIIFNVKNFTQIKGEYIDYFFSTKKTSGQEKIIFFQLRHLNTAEAKILVHKQSQPPYSVEITTSQADQLTLLSKASKFGLPKEKEYLLMGFNLNIPYIPLGNYYTHELTDKYSEYIQLNVENKARFIESLRVMIPNIVNIEVNKGVINESALFIAETGKNDLQPLGMYGDGVLKLVRILLSLFSERASFNYNRIMIDEIDTGVHYSRLTDFLEAVLKVCKYRGVQLFATSHSAECIESFTKALEKTGMQAEGRIIRLAETKVGIKAFTMGYEEFENALHVESEIR